MPFVPAKVNTLMDLTSLFEGIAGDMSQIQDFYYGDEKELLKNSRTGANYPLLLLDLNKMTYDENQVDYLAVFQPQIWVLDKVKNNNRTEQNTVQSNTQLLIEEIIARLDYYSKKYQGVPPFTFLRRTEIRSSKKFAPNNEHGFEAILNIRRTKNVRWKPA